MTWRQADEQPGDVRRIMWEILLSVRLSSGEYNALLLFPWFEPAAAVHARVEEQLGGFCRTMWSCHCAQYLQVY